MSIINIKNNKGRGGKYGQWRIISILVVGIMAGSALYTANFVYKNIYITLSNASTIIVLSSNLGVDAIDVKNYNLAEEKKTLKTQPFVWPEKSRNILNYDTKTSTSTTSTEK